MSTSTASEPEKTILVVGDSHTEQWLGVLEPMAEERNYQIVAVLMGGCSFGGNWSSRWPACDEFNRAALDYALELKPDAVFTVATAAEPADALDRPVAGLVETSERLREEGIPVIGVRDNPRFGFNVFECAEANGPLSPDCISDVAEKLSHPEIVASFFDSLPGVELIDMTDIICPDGRCTPVVGNVYVYMDSHHLTTTFTASTFDEFDRRFHEAVKW